MAETDGQWSRKAYACTNNVRPASLDSLLVLSPAELARCDIARVNLLCAEGLPGAEELNVDECLAMLDKWTGAVRRFTGDHLPRFRDNPFSNGGDGH